MEETFIKAFRKLLNWRWADNPNMLALWMRLLLRANFEENKWHGITIQRGQFVTSIAKLSVESGLSIKQVRVCLERLKETGEIDMKGTNKYSIITICNYDCYQSNESIEGQTKGKQRANKGQTKGKQRATNKEREERKDREEINGSSFDKEDLSESPIATPTPQPSVDYSRLVSFFNDTTQGVFGFVRLPLSDRRKEHIKARIREHGKQSFVEVVNKAMASDFLKGQNKRGFKATLDWLILPSNYEKVLSGNYDNHTASAQPNGRDLIGNDNEFTTD